MAPDGVEPHLNVVQLHQIEADEAVALLAVVLQAVQHLAAVEPQAVQPEVRQEVGRPTFSKNRT